MKFKNIPIVIGIFLIGLICGIAINLNSTNQIFVQSQSTEKTPENQIETTSLLKSDVQSLPWLDFPLEYFSKDDVEWGSAGKGNGDKITDYTQAAIKNMAVYQSYPVTNTTIQSYSNEVVPLKLLSASETQAQITKMQMGSYQAEESFKKYGILSSHYLPTYYIYDIDKFDVDGDGQDESIVSYSQTEAAGIGAPMTDIIKGTNIIFTLSETGSTVNSILPAETNNGFYVEWGSVGEFTGRCCEEGVKRTRFVFKDGKFAPIYEQEVRYLKIGKE